MPKLIGASLLRREDRPLLTGKGQYAGDLNLPGLLHVSIVRSVYPHARIRAIHADRARHMPGVTGVFSKTDLPEISGALNDPVPPGLDVRPRPVLAEDRVRYVGEPIAVVVADSSARASDAAEAVEIEYEPLDGSGDVTVALHEGATPLHADSNVAGHVERSFGEFPVDDGDTVTVRGSFSFGRVIGGYMEPRATAASLDPETGRLTLWTSTQWVYGVRDRIATILNLDRAKIHVLAPDVGGAFGAKGQVYPEEILIAALAMRLRQPVRWVATRTEDTQATGQSHGDRAEAELLASRSDGRLRGLRVKLQHDIGAYGGPAVGQSDNILSHCVSAYRLPAFQAESTLVYTNTVPTGFIRGGGRELGNFIVERMMDRLAQALRVDPAELRRRNLIQPDQMPYETGYKRMGRAVVYDGGDYPTLLERALAAVDYDEARQRQASGAPIGIGVACCVESAGIQQPEPAIIRIQPDGEVHAYLGSTPGGQGHRTTFAQVIAQHLEWPVERVQVFVGDSDSVSSSSNTAGSRSALEVGNAAAMVAASARAQLLGRAQTALEAGAQDITIGPSGASVRGAPGNSVELAKLLGEAFESQETFQSSGAYTGACHAAVLEVDPETATISVVRYAIAHDCGQVINPMLVNGQLQGGLVHGFGYALMEQAVYLSDGTLASANFADYTLPGRGIPLEVKPELVEVHSQVLGKNPEGFKGIGETGTIAAPAAIVAAVEDALRCRGVDTFLSSLPLTPTRLFAALHG